MTNPRKFTTAAVLLAAGLPLYAQVAPTTAQDDEEVVVLTPFEVTAESNTGYQATDTLAGTRIRTELRDVASAISVITPEFLRDIGATDSSTLLQYTTNTEVAGTRGTYAGLGNATGVDESGALIAPSGQQRVRGLSAADNTRDFFATDIPWDSSNVDRIDINRGANSFLFGLGSPAGIVNASIKSAQFTDRGSVEARFGSYGSVRFSLDMNEQLIPNVLALRIGGLWDHEKFRQDPAFEDDERYSAAVRWDPQLIKADGWHTSIRGKFEHGKIDANRPRIIPPNDSITPWWNSVYGGMNRLAVDNAYTLADGRAVGTTYNSLISPWLGTVVNQQQPFWVIDGDTANVQRVMGGYINNGAINSSGNFTGISTGIIGKRYAEQIFRIADLNQVANTLGLPGASYGQFHRQSLTDDSVFDFYNTLIDGPTKGEWENWDAYNLDFSQTAFNDRVGLNVIYDHQEYDRGGQQLLGGSPTITIDMTKNLQDFYLTPGADGFSTVTNPNFGRPYTISGGGSGSSYESEREHVRGSLFAELRASDVLEKGSFLEKLLGKHRFNGVISTEDYSTETKGWVMYAHSQAWGGYWNANDGSSTSITDRNPTALIYLGGSVAGLSSSSGANIPGITGDVVFTDANIYTMDSTWKATGVSPSAPWTPTGNLTVIYPLTAANGSPITYTQSQNPANYKGWGNNLQDNLLRYNLGEDPRLLTRSALSARKTKSYAGSWQGFLWNEAIVGTLGWRYDEVKSKAVNAFSQGNKRGELQLSPTDTAHPYSLDAQTAAEFKDHSTSGGVVVHLNRLFNNDPLPINISLSYNKSSNFAITDARRDIYGNVIANPTGATKDYGILLSTKDGKYSFRAIKYETSLTGGSSGIGDPGGIGRVIQQGLRFRNVFSYDLGGYTWETRNQPQSRNTWGGSTANGDPVNGADQTLTAAQGRALEDQAITTWNEIQAYLTPKGFFEAWGFTPVPLSKLGTRSQIEAAYVNGDLPSGSQYYPAAVGSENSVVYGYTSAPPPGFTVTADTVSKGYEFEFTANPTPNWRIAFNASKTEAVRSNVGGDVLDEFISYIDSKLEGQPAGNMPQFGNTSLSIYANVYGPWRANYVLMKLQEGAAAPEIRKWRYNVVTNYSFTDGPLKNFGVGGSYRWQDKVVIGYPVTSGGSFDLTKPYNGPSEDSIDFWISYQKKLTEKIDWKIQLNVRNAFAGDEVIPISVQPDGKTWASVRIAPTQEWFITNTFSF